MHFRIQGTRVVVMLVVTLAQLVLLTLFDFSLRLTRKNGVEPPSFLIIIKSHSEKPHPYLNKLGAFKATPPKIAIPDVTLNISPDTNSTSSKSRPIDWHAAASKVASEAAKRFKSTQFRSFDKQDPCSTSDPLNKLKKECQSQPNQIDWDSELSSSGFGFGKRPPANGTLFEHLKPEYLKKPVEDICTKNMVGCNHSSSSSAEWK